MNQTDVGRAKPFGTLGPPSAELRPARWLWALLALVMIAGMLLGALTGDLAALRVVRAIFFASAFGYLTVALVDFWEHFRLEKEATGKYLSISVVPIGETLNHAATVFVLVTVLVLARPVRLPLALRDWYVLVAPALFLALGWRDELVYHRKRARHREDILHTVAHLAVGVMLASFAPMRLVDWDSARSPTVRLSGERPSGPAGDATAVP